MAEYYRWSGKIFYGLFWLIAKYYLVIGKKKPRKETTIKRDIHNLNEKFSVLILFWNFLFCLMNDSSVFSTWAKITNLREFYCTSSNENGMVKLGHYFGINFSDVLFTHRIRYGTSPCGPTQSINQQLLQAVPTPSCNTWRRSFWCLMVAYLCQSLVCKVRVTPFHKVHCLINLQHCPVGMA